MQLHPGKLWIFVLDECRSSASLATPLIEFLVRRKPSSSGVLAMARALCGSCSNLVDAFTD